MRSTGLNFPPSNGVSWMGGYSHSGVAEGKLRQQRAKGRLWREDAQLPGILRAEECFMHIAQGGWWGWSYRSPTPGEETLRKHRSMEEVANLR